MRKQARVPPSTHPLRVLTGYEPWSALTSSPFMTNRYYIRSPYNLYVYLPDYLIAQPPDQLTTMPDESYHTAT